MLNFVLIAIVCVALAMSLFVGVYALFRGQSYKKNYFLLMQAMIVIYLFGYLLEVTSTNAEEAYTAVKVLYIGASLVATFAFFFVADYCNIRLHPLFVKFPMVLVVLAVTITMWTTKYHHLVYRSYFYDTAFARHLEFIPGPLYSLLHFYPFICMILAMAVLIHQMIEWKNKYRRQLLLLLICVAIPFMAEGIYYVLLVTGVTSRHIYLTPHSMAIMSSCLYIGVIRFNIFEVISMATVTAMEHIREGVVLVDESNNYMASNSATAKMIPGITKLVKGESIFATTGWPIELEDAESNTAEFSIITDGITRYFTASISPVFNKNQTIIAKIILFREITDSVNLMKELENAAYIDALTGIYNRKHFFELANADIERALRLNQSIYTAMLDLDFFKKVNDTYGHAAGDMVLKSTAGIIRQTIRSYDLVCRYGGEEFVLLITALEPAEAFRLVERIRENMEHSSLRYENEEIKITCSIGLAEFYEIDTLETSIKKADEALYTAKNSGRNQVKVYEPGAS